MTKSDAKYKTKVAGEAVKILAEDVMEKTGSAFANAGNKISRASTKAAETISDESKKLLADLKEQKEKIDEQGFSETALQTTQDLILKLSSVPLVRVDREEFLRKTFGKSQYIEQIIELGPQAVFTPEALRKKADDVIKNSTRKTTVASFAAGFPSNIVLMIAAGTADVAQYFGFVLNLAQKIAYLFGEDQIFLTPVEDVARGQRDVDILDKDDVALPEDVQIKILGYLGTMLGVAGAGNIILKTSKKAGIAMGKKVGAKALTKTAWYPVVKKVGSLLGYEITKKTVENTISKAVPVVGGGVSALLTYVTFKPLGGRLADVFVAILKGEYNEDLELNPEFAKSLVEEETNDSVIDAAYRIIEEETINGDSEPDAVDISNNQNEIE